MDLRECEPIIEAILFAQGEAVSGKKICEILGIDEMNLTTIMERMMSRKGGVLIRRLGDSYQMCTHPDYHEQVRKIREKGEGRSLSQAAYETLAVIAYNQTATRARIESVRGVNSGSSLVTLLEKGLIEEKGRADAPGRPVVYGPTEEFLRAFGLRDFNDLIPLELTEEWQEAQEEEQG